MVPQTLLDIPKIKPYPELCDLESIAIDLNDGLSDPSNNDIALDFEAIVNKYKGDIWHIKSHLETMQARCQSSAREQFIIFAGPRAVGVSMVAIDEFTPANVNPSWPNVSLFICNPHRGRGIGKLTLERQLQAVNENFGGHAWTEVRVDNIPSQRLVKGAGFVDTEASLDPGMQLYLYRG